MNLLDNALEAAAKTEKRWVSIRIAPCECADWCQLTILNSKPNRQLVPNEKNNGYVSTKSDADKHGFGTQMIQKLVEKNGGSVQYLDGNTTMQIDCRLCLISE